MSPVRASWLMLNGDGKGPINNLCVPTKVHAGHPRLGQSFVSVTVLGVVDDLARLEGEVRAQLVDRYGEAATRWEHLRSYAIPEVLFRRGFVAPTKFVRVKQS